MRRLACMVMVAGLTLWGCGCAPATDSSSGTGTDGSGDNGGSGINSAEPAGEHVPEIGESVSVVIVNHSGIEADVHVRFLVGDYEVRRTDLRVLVGQTTDAIGPDLATSIEINGLFTTGDATPKVTWLLGKNFVASDVKQYILEAPGGPNGTCPDGSVKTSPGVCGCDVPDTDSDGDGTPDCVDKCPNDPNKTAPGACGCGKPETDTDGDGTPDCVDKCPGDPNKTAPGVCGCGVADVDANHNGTIDCLETHQGGGGGGPSDIDADGIPDSQDNCPDVPNSDQADVNENGVGDACEPRACCLPDGSCQSLSPQACQAADGTARALGVVCESADCPAPSTEACCLPTSGECSKMTAQACEGVGGSPQGEGTNCQKITCSPPPATEACCLDGVCSEVEPSQCTSMNGLPWGAGTTCQDTDCTIPPVPLGVLVVKWNAPPGGDGESWPTAFQSIQDALTKAAESQNGTGTVWSEIWVAQGTYKPDDGSGDRSSSFQLRSGAHVYGGFVGIEGERSQRNIDKHTTILSGDIGQAGDDTDNCYHVVTADEGVDQADALDGFTIEAGNASGAENWGIGGGIRSSIASCGLNNLVIRNCKAASAGGGMYISSGEPHLVHCVFENNWAGQQGGGLAMYSSLAVLERCRFTGNQAGTQGGAIYAHYCSSMLVRSDFVTNQAVNQGGAVVDDGCSLHMVNCQFVGNTATASDSTGGAIYSTGDYPLLEMMNCRLSGNTAGMGGGLYQYGDQYYISNYDLAGQMSTMIQSAVNGSIVLVNSTLHRNASLMSEQGGGAIYNAAGTVEATNCIVWDNLGGTGQADTNAIYPMGEGSNVTLTYSCAPGSWGLMSTNTGLDPLFTDPDGPDNVLGNWDDMLVPAAGSPALNSGSNDAILPDAADLDSDGVTYEEKTPFDLADQPRVVGSAVDMGAYER